MMLLFIFFPTLRILNSPTSWSLQPRLPPAFTSPTSSSLYASMRSIRVPLYVDSSVTWVGKLWPVQSRNLLDWYCPAVYPPADIGVVKALQEARTCECEACSSCLKKASCTSSCSGGLYQTPTTHHLCWSACSSWPISFQLTHHSSLGRAPRASAALHVQSNSSSSAFWPAFPKKSVSSHGSTQLWELTHHVSGIPSSRVVWPGTRPQAIRGITRKLGLFSLENRLRREGSGGLTASDTKKGQRESWAGLSLRIPIDQKLQEEEFWSDITKNISPCECSKTGTGDQKGCGVSMLGI